MLLDLLTHRFLVLFDGFFTSTNQILDCKGRDIPLLERFPLMILVPLHDHADRPAKTLLRGLGDQDPGKL